MKPGECLPPSMLPLLDRLQLRDLLLPDAHRRSYGNRSVWGSALPVDRESLFAVHGPGFHIDRCRFEGDLAEKARRAGVDWRWGVHVLGGRRRAHGWTLATRLGREEVELEADFVIDASGRQAVVARGLGGRRVRHDRLVGLSTILEGRNVADSFTLVEAVESGWWYSASLSDGRLAVAYMTDADLLNSSGARNQRGWIKRVGELSLTSKRVEHCAGSLCKLAGSLELRVLPAESSRLRTIAGDRWLAVGDAAAAYDPLSSYGIASAMGSGYYAACAVRDYLEGRTDAPLAYVHIMEQTYRYYLQMLAEGYIAEQRWPDAPFWKRRHYQQSPARSTSYVDPQAREVPWRRRPSPVYHGEVPDLADRSRRPRARRQARPH